jgi:hypothetical protein
MGQVYLVGAGFTRAVIGEKAPLTAELMQKLDISRFPEIWEEYEKAFPDIEQFISILDLRVIHSRQTNDTLSDRLNKTRDDIVRQIVKQVDIARLRVDKLDGYPNLKTFVETIPCETRILTLNYDCVLDQGLYLSGRWSPFGGYCYSTSPHTQNDNNSKDRILLLKLHGSCNFKDSEKVQEYPNIEITDNIFPNIHANINSDQSDKPHILVMSYVKQFHNGIMSLWREAISFLRASEKLIIVGCSLREEDTFLRFALYHFGMNESVDQFSIDIVDWGNNNCNKIKEKVLKLVAYPDRQKVELFDGGLASYLDRT